MANPYGVLTATPGSRYPGAVDDTPASRDLQGYWVGGPQGKPKPSSLGAGQLAGDYPSMDAATGTFINTRTRQPWTGKLQDGTYAHQGKRAPAPGAGEAIDPNDVASRYQAVDVAKDPAVSSATDDLLAAFKKGAADSLKGFDDYIKEFKSAASTTQAANKDAVAQADTTAATLQGAQARYSGDLDAAKGDYAALNAKDAAAQQAIVAANNDLLPKYDEAGNAIADRQLQEVVKNLSRYKMGTGTPTSLGSDESRILAQGAADVMLPLKQAQINKRYDILNNVALPVERDITNRETSRISNFNPMVAGQQYSSTQSTASAVQALKEAVARQDWQSALQIMQVPEISAHVQQQIMAGDTSLLGAISQLRDSSHYRGLQDKLGVNLSQPIYSSPGDLQYPAPSRYARTIGTGANPALGGNAPVQVSASATSGRQPTQIDNAYKIQTGVYPWEDPYFSKESYADIAAKFTARNNVDYGTADGPYGGPNAPGRTTRYDSASGNYYNNGEVVGHASWVDDYGQPNYFNPNE